MAMIAPGGRNSEPEDWLRELEERLGVGGNRLGAMYGDRPVMRKTPASIGVDPAMVCRLVAEHARKLDRRRQEQFVSLLKPGMQEKVRALLPPPPARRGRAWVIGAAVVVAAAAVYLGLG